MLFYDTKSCFTLYIHYIPYVLKKKEKGRVIFTILPSFDPFIVSALLLCGILSEFSQDLFVGA